MKSAGIVFFFFFLCAGCFGNTIRISKDSDFVDLVYKAERGDFNDDIELEIDLDFNSEELKKVIDHLPLGLNNGSNFTPYSGTFNGKNHHVKNLKLLNKESSGFIFGAGNAVIKNLVVDDTCVFSGDTVGCVVVNVTGDLTVDNVTVYGTIHVKKESAGGVIGTAYNLTGSSITVKNSGFHGSISGESYDTVYTCYHYGGLIGSVLLCSNTHLTLTKNANNATINATFASLKDSYATKDLSGFVGGFRENKDVDVVVSDNVNEVRLIDLMDDDPDQIFAGGMFGYIWGSGISVLMENNVNKAKLLFSTNGLIYAGGYIGNIYMPEYMTLTIKKNTNYCDLLLSTQKSSICFGGYVGYSTQYSTSSVVFESNINNGKIHIDSNSESNDIHSGGLFGFFNSGSWKVFDVYNNTNNADIVIEGTNAGSYSAGGIAGRIYPYNRDAKFHVRFSNNINRGNIHAVGAKTTNLGGIVGQAYFYGSADFCFDNNVNEGFIHAEETVESFNTWNIGGIVGVFTVPHPSYDDFQDLLIGNTNKGEIQVISSAYIYIGGIVGYFHDDSSTKAFFNNNINHGSISAVNGKGNYIGGLAGYLSIQGGEHNETSIVENKNSGNIFVKSTVSVSQYIAGLVAYAFSQCLNEVPVKDNINEGNIHVIGVSAIYTGGVFGSIAVSATTDLVHFENNTNKGDTDVESNSNSNRNSRMMMNIKSDYYGYSAGLVGSFTFGQMLVVDSANYGHIIVNFDSESSTTCGLVCSSGTGRVSFENSMNGATVQGGNAYGIALLVSGTNNIVSSGVVSGTYDSYSFWKSAREVPSSLFGLKDKCANCDGNVTLITKDPGDGKYHTVDGDKALVDSLLNTQAEKNGYKRRWSHDLILERIITIHFGRPLNQDLDVLSGTTLIEIAVLTKYLESKDYAVGDINSNTILDQKSVVTEGMTIIAIERHEVVIEMNEVDRVLGVDVDISELAKSLSIIAEIDVNEVLIELEVDGKGYVLRVIVILSSDELSEKVVDSVNRLIKEGQCGYAILCRANKAYIVVEEQTISGSNNHGNNHIFIGLVLLMLTWMMLM